MKRFIKIFIIVLIIGMAVFGGIIYYTNVKTNKAITTGADGTNSSGITLRDFIPFSSSPKVDTPDTTTVDSTPTPTDTAPTGEQPKAKLVQLTGEPIAGLGFATVTALLNPADLGDQKITVTPTVTLVKDLKLNSTSSEVKEIQKLLNQCKEFKIAESGTGSPGKEGTKFTLATENALKVFQTMFKPANATDDWVASGKVDIDTRALLNAPFECTKPLPKVDTVQKEVLRYVEKATGHVYETPTDATDIQKITKTTIPRVHDATFVPGTDAIAYRYLKNNIIQTFIGTVPSHIIGDGTPAGDFKGTFLPENISDITAAPTGGKLFYISPYSDGVVGDIYTVSLGKSSEIFRSPFSEWKTSFYTGANITLTTKASAQVPGYMYTLDVTNKSFTKVFGNILGMTTLMSPDKTKFFYSSTIGDKVSFALYDISKKYSATFNITTLPAKCVWGKTVAYCAVPNNFPTGQYPDAWYQGLVTFSDKIYKIDTVFGTTKVLVDPISTVGQEIDATNLALNATETNLYFINKKDSSLWALSLIDQQI
jgi:hypothetical protein